MKMNTIPFLLADIENTVNASKLWYDYLPWNEMEYIESKIMIIDNTIIEIITQKYVLHDNINRPFKRFDTIEK